MKQRHSLAVSLGTQCVDRVTKIESVFE